MKDCRTCKWDVMNCQEPCKQGHWRYSNELKGKLRLIKNCHAWKEKSNKKKVRR